MASPAGPIYASSLHRRDRAWGLRRRGVRRMIWALRGVTWGALLATTTLLLVQHVG